MGRDRTLYIVEIANGNWHTITRVKAEAESARDSWNAAHGGAVVIPVSVPERPDDVAPEPNIDVRRQSVDLLAGAVAAKTDAIIR